MPDTVLALPKPEPPPRDLGTPIRGFDRMALAVLADRYDRVALDRALNEIEASKRARTSA